MNFETAGNILYPDIVAKIQTMVDADQSMRDRPLYEFNDQDRKVDIDNTTRMKEIVAEIGWPTVSKVGEECSCNCWLLLQHADHDVVFQAQCLQFMNGCAPGEVDIENIPYLED